MESMELLQNLNQRAKTDEAFRTELEADPEGVLARETGLTPADVERMSEELGEAELQAVAGGGWLDIFRCETCRFSTPWYPAYLLHKCDSKGGAWRPDKGLL